MKGVLAKLESLPTHVKQAFELVELCSLKMDLVPKSQPEPKEK